MVFEHLRWFLGRGFRRVYLEKLWCWWFYECSRWFSGLMVVVAVVVVGAVVKVGVGLVDRGGVVEVVFDRVGWSKVMVKGFPFPHF